MKAISSVTRFIFFFIGFMMLSVFTIFVVLLLELNKILGGIKSFIVKKTKKKNV